MFRVPRLWSIGTLVLDNRLLTSSRSLTGTLQLSPHHLSSAGITPRLADTYRQLASSTWWGRGSCTGSTRNATGTIRDLSVDSASDNPLILLAFFNSRKLDDARRELVHVTHHPPAFVLTVTLRPGLPPPFMRGVAAVARVRTCVRLIISPSRIQSQPLYLTVRNNGPLPECSQIPTFF